VVVVEAASFVFDPQADSATAHAASAAIAGARIRRDPDLVDLTAQPVSSGT
jgi:hypothetical protein